MLEICLFLHLILLETVDTNLIFDKSTNEDFIEKRVKIKSTYFTLFYKNLLENSRKKCIAF